MRWSEPHRSLRVTADTRPHSSWHAAKSPAWQRYKEPHDHCPAEERQRRHNAPNSGSLPLLGDPPPQSRTYLLILIAAEVQQADREEVEAGEAVVLRSQDKRHGLARHE